MNESAARTSSEKRTRRRESVHCPRKRAARWALRGMVAPPRSRANSTEARKHPSEMTLVRKAAGERYLGKRRVASAHHLLRLVDAAPQQPLMGGNAYRGTEGSREMAG